jgi:hypothetical protein
MKVQFQNCLAFDLAFMTFVGLFDIFLRFLRSEKSGTMQQSWAWAFYHQKQLLLEIFHFESVGCVSKRSRDCFMNFKPRVQICNFSHNCVDANSCSCSQKTVIANAPSALTFE